MAGRTRRTLNKTVTIRMVRACEVIGVLRRNSSIRHFLHLPSVCKSWFPSISVSHPSSRSSTDRSKDPFQTNLGTNPLPRLVVDVHISSVSRPPTELCLTPKPCRQRYLSSHITALVIHHQCPPPLPTLSLCPPSLFFHDGWRAKSTHHWKRYSALVL